MTSGKPWVFLRRFDRFVSWRNHWMGKRCERWEGVLFWMMFENYFPGNAGALRWYMMIYYVPIWWYMMIYYVPILQGKTSLEMVGKEWLAWRHWGDEIRIYTYTYHIHIYIYNNPTYPTCRSSSFYECLFGALAPHQLWLTHAGTNAGTVVSQWSPSWIIYRC